MATQLIKRVFTWALADISHFFFIEQNYIEIIYWQYYLAILYWQYYPAIWSVISNTLPVWKKECQYTASSRDELENTPLRQFAPLNHRDCPRASGCKLPQGVYIPTHPSSRQNFVTLGVDYEGHNWKHDLARSCFMSYPGIWKFSRGGENWKFWFFLRFWTF